MKMSYKDTKLLRTFGSKVRNIRHSKKISQELLAELADLDRTYISGVERGIRNISLINISALARALEVSLPALTEDL
jgi:transcriptional regulator with XRE-family HTH domain